MAEAVGVAKTNWIYPLKGVGVGVAEAELLEEELLETEEELVGLEEEEEVTIVVAVVDKVGLAFVEET